jgi:hypothetical protein
MGTLELYFTAGAGLGVIALVNCIVYPLTLCAFADRSPEFQEKQNYSVGCRILNGVISLSTTAVATGLDLAVISQYT